MNNQPAILFEGVGKRFDDGPPVLEGIDLSVARGDFVSLIGPSGCGKTTILRMVAGLSRATAGVVRLNGQTPVEARARLGFIFQDPTLMPWLTVAGNIEAPLRIKGVEAVPRRRICAEMLDRVRLREVASRYPRQLSGGMKMRVSVARALALSPELLLLDEPFGALDEMTRNHLNEELLELRAHQTWTACFVTHSVSEAVFLSNRIVILGARPGRILAEIPVPFSYPRTQELRERSEFHELVDSVAKTLRRAEPSAVA